MSPDEEVGDDPVPSSLGCSSLAAPERPRLSGGVGRQRLEHDAKSVEGMAERTEESTAVFIGAHDGAGGRDGGHASRR